jgi:hypothetical protein
MSLRARYSASPPMLALGTVLCSTDPVVAEPTSTEGEAKSQDVFWLCLQPACDCYIRTKPPLRRAFPMLRLAITDKQFNLIVEQSGAYVHLLWKPKTYNVKMFEFEANSTTKSVMAIYESEEFWFPTSESNNMRFRWVGQLKFPQAQRVAQALASEAARVGLTESEWLRRNAKKS